MPNNNDDIQKWYQAMEIDELYFSSSSNSDITKEKNINMTPKHNLYPPLDPKNTPLKNNIDNNNTQFIAANCKTLEELKKAVEDFEGCQLKFGAKNTVFSDGNSGAKVMLIGEAPGATEDDQGIPFCGESGKLLDKMLASIGLIREKNFYISNTIFWRPPANRAPTTTELSICKPFVEKHIALIKPELLVLVGGTAVLGLLGPQLKISRIRQEYYSYNNQFLEKPIPTTAIFHPAYLLRQPMQKKTMWQDLLKIKDYINSQIPGYL